MLMPGVWATTWGHSGVQEPLWFWGVMQIGGVCVAICCHGDIQAWAVDEDYDYLPWIGSMLMSVAYSGSKGHMGLGHNLWPH